MLAVEVTVQVQLFGSRFNGNTLATLFAHYLTVWTMERSVVGTRVLVVL